jgi:hypothetical protein
MPQPPQKKARYEQSKDRTLLPFLPKKAAVIGALAMSAQIAGEPTTATHVRVSAHGFSDTHMGQGLHEVVPTSLHGAISAMPKSKKRTREAAAEVQSGARTTPALTPMTHQGKTFGHTGTFVNLAKKGASTHTSGQSSAHDALREGFHAAVETGMEGDEMSVHMAAVQFSVMPPGPQLLNSPDVTGAQPNLKLFGPLESPTAKKRPNRIGLVRLIHSRREASKARARAAQRELKPLERQRTRSPSPEREPIDAHGGGGGYIKNPKKSRVTPMPQFPDKHRSAHLSAWIFQPLRHSEPLGDFET